MTEASQDEVPAHVHDYDEEGDCRVCGRDLFAGSDDVAAGGGGAVTAVTPGQALHDSLRKSATTTFGLLVSDFPAWDEVPQWQRDRLEDAGKSAVEAARLRQPEELAAVMADPRMVALDPALLHKELHKILAERDELRKLLDEIGVIAANAPEDGDSFGLLEEIAMRIGAAGVPDSTPVEEWPDPGNPVTGRTPGAAAPELAALAEAGQLREQLADTARALDLARDEITSVRNVLARVLGEFKRSGSGHTARLGQVVIARAYRDGGLPLPDDLAGLGD